MNIVHVVESLALGGLEQVVVSLAKIQLRAGHRVLVLCLFEEGVLAAQILAAGGEVVVCHKASALDWRAVRALRSAVRSFRADVVHTHNAVPHYYAALATIGLPRHALINTRHGMAVLPFSWRREFLYRLAMSRTGAAVSVCDAVRTKFVSHRVMPVAKAVTVPNGIDVSAYRRHDSAGRAALMATCQMTGDPVIFGIVGRLNPVKDHVGLLRAVRILVDDGVDMRLVIIGDGKVRSTLEQEIDRLSLSSHVHLLGARSDVPTLLTGLDAFVLSSISEGYSLAIVEACASGLPCVVTDVGGNREIVRDGETGVLVPASDPPRLAHAMRLLCDNAALRESMGRKAREWALEHGTLEAMDRQYHLLYQRGAVAWPGASKHA